VEEIMEDGVVYVQSPVSSTLSCKGCSFFDESEQSCFANRKTKLTTVCYTNDTIWIKKESKVNTEPVKDFIGDKSVTKPGVKHDQEKERYDLVPVLALEEVAKVLTAGAAKYDDENWRKVPNATRRYFSAAQRHLAWVRKGQTHDQETKLHHYAHAITNLMFLLEKELEITKD